ncbi:hypothetical protein ACA910_016798 [Epithemia clementina (nom. ined.)]
MARFRSLPFVGKRSGVVLDDVTIVGENENRNMQQGDFDAVFAAAAAANTGRTKSNLSDNRLNDEEVESNQQSLPLRKMRFSLEGEQQRNPSIESNTSFIRKQRGDNSSSTSMMQKIKGFSGSISESDLSPVTAATPLKQKQDPAGITAVQEEEETTEDKEDSVDDVEIQNEAETPTILRAEPTTTPLQQPATNEKETTEDGTDPPESEKSKNESTDNVAEEQAVPMIHDVEEEQAVPMIAQDDDSGDGLVNDDHDDSGDGLINDDHDDSGDGLVNDDHESLPDDGAHDDLIPPSPPDSPNDEGGDIGIVNTPETIAEKEKVSPEVPETPTRNTDPPPNKKNNVSEKNDDDDEEPSPEKEHQKKPEKKSRKAGDRKKKTKSAMKKTKAKKMAETGRKRRGPTSEEEDDNSDHRSVVIKVPAKKKRKVSRFTTTFSPKGIPLPREYETIPVSDLKETPPPGVRRSRRARCRPLEYWKNERAEYGPPDDDETISSDLFNMPVVKAYVRSKETPYKPRMVPQVSRSQPNKKAKSRIADPAVNASDYEQRQAAFDSSKLKQRYKYSEGDEALLWDEGVEDAREQKVVSYVDSMETRKLPLSKDRLKSEGKVVGKAAQAFNVPNGPNPLYVGFITGNLLLPPKGIKDAESVGACSQVFTVVRCQPGAMEVAYSDPEDENSDSTLLNPETATRFLLKPGDLFRIPPGNSYRLCNHSKTSDAFLTWTIIRPANLAAMQDNTSNNTTPR